MRVRERRGREWERERWRRGMTVRERSGKGSKGEKERE